MAKYLGETSISSLVGNPYADYGPKEWAMKYITFYGGIDGDHHKTWVLDQVSRILMGTPIKLKLAKWADGQEEYRFTTGKPSKEYLDWVKDIKEGGYDYDEGIAP